MLEDSGEPPAIPLSREQACAIAETLGHVQCCLEDDQNLPLMVPRCDAEKLYEQVVAICHWASVGAPTAHQQTFLRLTRHIEQAQVPFAALATPLAELPATIIHGDVWSGNAMFKQQQVRLIDWSDAFWGIGGVSLAHFLASERLEDDAPVLWQAYEQGRGLQVSQQHRLTCQMVLDCVDLIVDYHLALRCHHRPESLPGLLPTLLRVEQLAWSL